MGLGERKAVQAIKDGEFKTFVQEVQKTCGYALAVDFDWASLENDKDCVWIVENKKMQGNFFTPLLTALKSICSDDMGKGAMKEKITGILGVNKSGNLAMEGNVVRIESSLSGNGVYGADHIKTFLEKNL